MVLEPGAPVAGELLEVSVLMIVKVHGAASQQAGTLLLASFAGVRARLYQVSYHEPRLAGSMLADAGLPAAMENP
jgi:hypothetical protein